jgi:hypothetical protein
MCKGLVIRVWDYDYGESYEDFVPYSPEKLTRLEERWGDIDGISGAMVVCRPLFELRDRLLCTTLDDLADVELPF